MGAHESKANGPQEAEVVDYYTLLEVEETATLDEIKVSISPFDHTILG
jgi:hypothetical protein